MPGPPAPFLIGGLGNYETGNIFLQLPDDVIEDFQNFAQKDWPQGAKTMPRAGRVLNRKTVSEINMNEATVALSKVVPFLESDMFKVPSGGESFPAPFKKHFDLQLFAIRAGLFTARYEPDFLATARWTAQGSRDIVLVQALPLMAYLKSLDEDGAWPTVTRATAWLRDCTQEHPMQLS